MVQWERFLLLLLFFFFHSVLRAVAQARAPRDPETDPVSRGGSVAARNSSFSKSERLLGVHHAQQGAVTGNYVRSLGVK